MVFFSLLFDSHQTSRVSPQSLRRRRGHDGSVVRRSSSLRWSKARGDSTHSASTFNTESTQIALHRERRGAGRRDRAAARASRRTAPTRRPSRGRERESERERERRARSRETRPEKVAYVAKRSEERKHTRQRDRKIRHCLANLAAWRLVRRSGPLSVPATRGDGFGRETFPLARARAADGVCGNKRARRSLDNSIAHLSSERGAAWRVAERKKLCGHKPPSCQQTCLRRDPRRSVQATRALWSARCASRRCAAAHSSTLALGAYVSKRVLESHIA